MSLAPRFVVLVSVPNSTVTRFGSVGKAARSNTISAGWKSMVPRRDMRRPFWSWFKTLSTWNRGNNASASALVSGGVAMTAIV